MTHLADNSYDVSLLQVQLVFGNSRVVEHGPTTFFYCGGIKHVFSDIKFTAIVIKLISKFSIMDLLWQVWWVNLKSTCSKHWSSGVKLLGKSFKNRSFHSLITAIALS